MKYLIDVVTLELDRDRCSGCGICLMVCPHGVLQVVEGKAEFIDRDLCMECGACAINCAPGAIQVESGVGCATGEIFRRLGSTSPECCADTRECC